MNNLPVPTFDNTYLSPPADRTTQGSDEISRCTHINRASGDALSNPSATLIKAHVRQFAAASLADNTRRAYRADLEDFFQWGATLPATSDNVASYLAERAATLSPHTLARRLVTITRAHRAAGFDNPCAAPLVRMTLQGIRRTKGMAQRRVDPLLREHVVELLTLLPDSLRGVRDRALLLIGFAGAFRRSEIAAMRVDDVRFVAQGVLIRLPRSKTDQVGEGRTVAIPHAKGEACPVRALRDWLEHANISSGSVFRRMNREGAIESRSVSTNTVALLIKEYVNQAGWDASRFSGHSLRAGLVTSAAKAGVSCWKIRQQTGHKSDAMIQRYVRDADLFNQNAAGLL